MSLLETHPVPTTGSLVAFECAARHGNFSHAANELGTSQPAISRHIASLEQQLSVRLFDRSREGATLTDAGRRYCDAVIAGLGIIRSAAADAATRQHSEQVVIVCSHDVSYSYVLPRYQALQKMLGEGVSVRVLTVEHDTSQIPLDSAADVVLTRDANVGANNHVVVHEETVRPLCSPRYAEMHAETLRQPVRLWGGLTFLDLIGPQVGCASWDDWFRVVGRPETAPRFRSFDSYGYVLEAAAAGLGIALGWRYCIERRVDNGSLIPLSEDFVEFRSRYCGFLTEWGRSRPLAHKCLAFFEVSA